MHPIFNNPLWWVLPAVLVASWVVNHKEISSKFTGKGGSNSKAKSSGGEQPSTSEPSTASVESQNTGAQE